MDRRALMAAVPGLVGLVVGTAAAVVGSPVLGMLAGGCALGSAATGMQFLTVLRRREEDVTSLEQRVVELARLPADDEQEAMAASDLAELLGEPDDPREPKDQGDAALARLDRHLFETTLEQRVAAARRQLQPVTLLLVALERNGEPDPATDREDCTRFTSVLDETLRESDVSCVLGERGFGIILEDTPESGGVWAAERLRVALDTQRDWPVRLAAGVAAYPSHALDARELAQRAELALGVAQTAGCNQVEVAHTD